MLEHKFPETDILATSNDISDAPPAQNIRHQACSASMPYNTTMINPFLIRLLLPMLLTFSTQLGGMGLLCGISRWMLKMKISGQPPELMLPNGSPSLFIDGVPFLLEASLLMM